MDRRLHALLFVLLAALVGSEACSWSQTPREQDAVVPVTSVGRTLGESSSARLYAVERGLWAYVPENGENTAELEPGRLVAHRRARRTRDSEARLYAVVGVRDWGGILQRLGPAPGADLPDDGTLELVDGTAPAGSALEAHSHVCLGDGPFTEAPCLREAPAGTRWYAYPLDSDGRVPLASGLGSAPMPVARRALLHRSVFGDMTVRAGPARRTDRWLAVELPGRFAEIPSAVVAAAEDCPVGAERLADFDTHVLRRDVSTPSHPLEAGRAAFRNGADALATCPEGDFTFATPSLFRPPLETLRGRFIGPAIFGMRGLAAGDLPNAGRARLLRASAALATGDPVAADLHLDHLYYEHLDALPDAVGLRAVQVAAAAGRPEAGLRRGWYATASDWSRSNEPLIEIGRAGAEAAFGRKGDQLSTLRELRETADQKGWHETLAWLDWRAAHPKRGASNAAGDLYRLYEQHREDQRPRWALLFATIAGAERGRHRSSVAPDLRRLAARVDADILYEAVAGRGIQARCPPTGDCPLDVYGRRLRSRLAQTPARAAGRLRHDLARLGAARYRPGFRGAASLGSLDSVRDRLETSLVLAPRLSDETGGDLHRATARRAGRAIAQGTYCQSDVPPWIGRYLETSGRADDRSSGTALLSWLAREGFSTACRDPAAAARRLAGRASDDPRVARLAAPLFAKLAVRVDAPDDRREIFVSAFETSRIHGPGSTCRTTGLALAAAEATRGELKDAEERMNEAVNCPGSGAEEYVRARDVIRGYVRVQRDNSLPRQVSRDVRSALNRIFHRPHRGDPACAGPRPLSFDLLDELPDAVAELAEPMKSAAKRIDADDDRILRLRTADRRLQEARSALDSMRASLEKGRPVDAAAALETARSEFVTLEHRPGMGRTELFARAVFGVAPDTLEEWTAPESAPPCTERPSTSDREEKTGSIPSSARMLRCAATVGRIGALADRLAEGSVASLEQDQLRRLVAAALLAGRRAAVKPLADRETVRRRLEAFCEP